jgi:hypothetical protein
MSRILIYFLLLSPIISFSQEKKLELDFKAQRSSLGSYDVYSIVNKERNKVCILAVSTNEVKGYILNQDYVLIKEFTAGKTQTRQVLVGGFFTGDKLHYLLAKDEDDDEMFHYTYDPATDINNYNAVNLEIRKGMFMGSLSLGDQFLFVIVKKKEDKINVYRFGKQESHEVLQFDYPGSELGEQSLHYAFSKEAGFSRASEISYINDWEEPSIEKAKSYCKMYYRNDSLVITIDKSVTTTRILELDLQTQKASSRQLTRTFEPCKDVQSSAFLSYNSCLRDGYLYSVVACADAMQLSVHDFYTGKIIKQYITEKGEEISFRSTDILQEGSAFYSKDEKKLEKTRQLLRKMTNGRALVIAKNTGESEVELTIGSYTSMKSGGGGMWMGGMGPGAIPMYIPTGGFSRQWSKSARFKTLLHVNDFEKTNGEVLIPVEEKIERYPVNKKFGYFYLDKKAMKLVVSAL